VCLQSCAGVGLEPGGRERGSIQCEGGSRELRWLGGGRVGAMDKGPASWVGGRRGEGGKGGDGRWWCSCGGTPGGEGWGGGC